MKVFICDYYWHGGYGAYEELYLVTVANTESEALGMCLSHHPASQAKDWSVTELDTSVAGTTYITSRCF